MRQALLPVRCVSHFFFQRRSNWKALEIRFACKFSSSSWFLGRCCSLIITATNWSLIFGWEWSWGPLPKVQLCVGQNLWTLLMAARRLTTPAAKWPNSMLDLFCFFFLLFGSSELQAVDNMLLAHFERYYDNFMANHFVYNFTAPRPRHAQIKTAMWAVHKMLRMIIDFTWQITGCECQFG